jgi:hypothetical protein
MARFVGNSSIKGTPGAGIEETPNFDRATGITTDSNNFVTAVTLGPRQYSSILYDYVGLITTFTETINGVSKVYTLTYDSRGKVLSIVGALA